MRHPRRLSAALLLALLSTGALSSRSADAHDGNPKGLSEAARAATATPQGAGPTGSLSGWFHIVYGDAPPGSPGGTSGYVLIDDQGQAIELLTDQGLLGALGGPRALNHQRVTVTGQPALAPPWAGSTAPLPLLRVQGIQLDTSNAPAAAPAPMQAVTGNQRWATVLCRFADSPGITPHPKAWFDTLLLGSASAPGLDHYWREVSYSTVNLTGSAVYGWYTLPQPRSYYVYGSPLQLDFQRAANDCTGVADADAYFPNFVGINLMFNEDLDCCAWGGSWTLTRDGQTRSYRMTWLPPWGYENQGVVAHEMGHGFGLPHSSGPYTDTYDSGWDVMSGLWLDCPPYDPVYGCVGTHTISYHKDILGWIPSAQKYVATAGSSQTITLERLAQPTSGSNYLMAQIPIGGSATQFYTVETRRFAGYDASLPGQAVILHRVDTTRSDRDAQVVDPDGNGNPNDAGAMWLPGETFVDSANGITITVNAQTGNAFQVSIASGVTSYTLSVTVSGPGTVTSNPAGITCSAGTCGASFASGTAVTLTPSGGTLSSWGGACAGTPPGPCTVQMTQPRSVTATFSSTPSYGATYQASAFSIPAGTTTTVPVTVTNTGSLTWPAQGAFRLSYQWYQGATLLSYGLRTLLPSTVAPGGALALQAAVQAPTTPSTYTLKWDMVHEGVTWFSWQGVPPAAVTVTVTGTTTFPLTISPTPVNGKVTGAGLDCGTGGSGVCTVAVGSGASVVLTASPSAGFQVGTWTGCQSQSGPQCTVQMTQARTVSVTFTGGAPPYGATYQASAFSIPAGTTTTVPVTVTNTGSLTWPAQGAFRLSYQWYQGATLLSYGLRTLLPSTVAPNGSLALQAAVQAPTTPGTYTLKWDMVHEGVTWFSWQGVPPAAVTVTVTGGAPPYGATYQASAFSIPAGTTTTVPVTVTNTGSLTWPAQGAFRLSYQWYQGATRLSYGLRTFLPSTVAPGGALALQAAVQAPTTPGTYTLKWDMVHEGVTWFSWQGVPTSNHTITVSP